MGAKEPEELERVTSQCVYVSFIKQQYQAWHIDLAAP